jgi:hypothetical protein
MVRRREAFSKDADMGEDLGDRLKPPELRPAIERPAPASTSSSASPRPASSVASPQQPGAYYSPPPTVAASVPVAKPVWPLAVLGAAVAAASLAVGTWYALKSPGPIPVISAPARNEKVFSVSMVDADLKATEYLKDVLSGKAAAASDADPLRAVNAPALKALAKTSPKAAEDVKSGRSVLYRVYLLDFLAEDGDRVELSVDGASYGDLYLKNAGQEVLIPLTRGVPSEMNLLATADGGGGVTVGFVSSLGEARTRTLQVGQSEQWQVTVQ